MNRLFWLFFILISGLYLFPRLNNLSQNLHFKSDQGIHLIEARKMLDGQRSFLLGPAVTSTTYLNRSFFIGPQYYYIIAVLGVISDWDPLIITAILIFVEFIFYTLFIYFLRLHFGGFKALFVFTIISMSPYLIFHSYFFWNPHFLIPLSIIFIILHHKFGNLSAFIWGLAVSFHYLAIFWGILFLKTKLKEYLKIFLLFLLANFPLILFDLRHQFYNLKTIFGTVFSKPSSGFTSHYLIFPFIIFTIYFLLVFSQKTKKPYYLLFLLFLFYKPLELYKDISDISFPIQNQIVNQILIEGCPKQFNIASTVNGDTRSFDLRHLLIRANCQPQSVEDYPNATNLYLIAPNTRPPETETVWEVNSFSPFSVKSSISLNDSVKLYHLTK